MNTQDPLMNFIENSENQDNKKVIIDNVQNIGPNTRLKVDKIEGIDEWLELPIDTLPYKKFYPTGMHIQMRPLKTIEKQNFATVNENNDWDVLTKLNEVFKTCIRVINPDGSIGSYRQIQSGDRSTVAIALARLSAKNGRKIQHTVKHNNQDVEIEMIPANYVYLQPEEWLEQYFNNDKKVYEFVNPKDNSVIALAPPTIGLEEDMNAYVIYRAAKSEGKDFPGLSFVTALPYIKMGKGIQSLPIENMDQEFYNFSKMNDEYFEVINDAIDYMTFGVQKLRKTLSTGETVECPFRYPDGARSLFIVPNALKKFVGQ